MINTRKTKLYKKMSNYTATGLAEGFIDAKSEKEVITAWQKLHDTGLAYRMQSFFGRGAKNLIDNGIILS